MNDLKNTDIYYEGEIINMFSFFPKRDNSKENYENKESDYTNEKDKTDELALKLEELTEKLENNSSKERIRFVIEFVSFLILLLTAFGGVFVYLHTQFFNMNNKIDACLTEEDIADLKTSVNDIESWILGDINDPNKIGANERFNTIESDLNTINNELNILPINISESVAVTNLKYTTSMENTYNNNNNVPLTFETYLGEDSNGKKYNIGDVVGEPVLLTYNEDNKEVYFYGQINEKLHWEGHCITNVYNSDETLFGICESDFDDGIRLNYESFYLSDVKDEWIYTNRTCEKEGNLGISQRYTFKYDKFKNFTNTNVRIYDLLYIEDFSSPDDKKMLTYYYGYTKNGKYNDQLNNEQHISYEIIFNPDGKVNILYIGEFVNGKFHDQTKNAIEIVYDSSNKDYKYFCYKGTFTKGNRDGKVSSNNYVTQKQINEMLLEKGIELRLNWYE